MPGLGKKHTEESKKKMSIAKKGKTFSAESRLKMSITKSAMYIGVGNPNYGKKHSEETRRKIAEKARGRKIPIETRLLISNKLKGRRLGKENPAWRGGVCSDPYCPDFTQGLKNYIKYRDGEQCQNPNCRGISKRLCVHHIDYNKRNCDPDNLITLCASCNSLANLNREWWSNFYNNIMRTNNALYTYK